MAQGHLAQSLEFLLITCDLIRVVPDDQSPLRTFEIENVIMSRLRKLHNNERALHTWMDADGEGDEFHRNIPSFAGGNQIVNLPAHHILAPDGTPHDRFIDDKDDRRSWLSAKQFLPFHPNFNQILKILRRRRLGKLGYGKVRIFLGLKKTWHEYRLESVYSDCSRLIVDELSILAGQDIFITAPPRAFS